MSILQVANIWFESTGNNRIQYTGSNTMAIIVAGANVIAANSTTTIMSALTATSVVDSIGNVRTVPVNSQTSAYVLVSTDSGKYIDITTGGVTVPGSIFTSGQTITIYNNSGSNQTITQGSGVTMYQVGTATTGNRTLAQRGLATVMCVGANTFVITGGGLS